METKVQRVTGKEFYGKSLVEYLNDNNLLYPNLSLIHMVWASDKDIELVARNGSKIIHSPVSGRRKKYMKN